MKSNGIQRYVASLQVHCIIAMLQYITHFSLQCPFSVVNTLPFNRLDWTIRITSRVYSIKDINTFMRETVSRHTALVEPGGSAARGAASRRSPPRSRSRSRAVADYAALPQTFTIDTTPASTRRRSRRQRAAECDTWDTGYLAVRSDGEDDTAVFR